MRTSHDSAQKAIRKAILLYLQGVYDPVIPIAHKSSVTFIPRFSDSKVFCQRTDLLRILFELADEGVIGVYTLRYFDWEGVGDTSLYVYSPVEGCEPLLELLFHTCQTTKEPTPEINYKEAFLEIAAVVAKYIPLPNLEKAK